jgi:energy-coupling factor transporter transmembrane protein EcfT
MAELTTFGFRPGNSVLYRLDARIKFILMALFSLVSLNAGFRGLFIFSALLLGVFFICRLPLISFVKETRYFLILLFFIFIARALTTPGTLVIQFGFIGLSLEGLIEGVLVCWRLTAVVLWGLLFIATSRPAEIRAAVQWFLSPFSFFPAKRAATMIGLVMRFVPVIFDQLKETSEALRARAIENRKNPVYRMKKLALPLGRRTFSHADQLVDAMTARCYNEDRTGPQLSFGPVDFIALAGAVPISLLILLL